MRSWDMDNNNYGISVKQLLKKTKESADVFVVATKYLNTLSLAAALLTATH